MTVGEADELSNHNVLGAMKMTMMMMMIGLDGLVGLVNFLIVLSLPQTTPLIRQLGDYLSQKIQEKKFHPTLELDY